MKKFLTLLLLIASAQLMAQNVGINSDGSTPNASAMLDVKSTNSGILIPRMTEAQRDAISSPATGLLVYQTDETSGFYYWNGTSWTIVGSGSGSGTVTSVATGTGLEGGPVTTTGTISLANTTVTAGSYTRATITVDAQGRITAAGDGAAVSLTGGVSGVLPIANGGTNASTAADARTNLGLGTAAVVNTGTSSGNVPVLDGTGKIPSDLLSISGMSYKGNKDLSANPTVPVEISGNYYIVSVAGIETGSGLAFAAGDWMISNGTVWQKITNSSAVTSVAGKTGVVTLDGADITSGTVAIARGGTGASTASGALTNLGATTVGSNMITLANPSAITFPRINADNTVSALDAAAFRTAIGATSGGGSVTSVAAGNGMNFTTITGSGPVTMGTPTTLTSATTNAVTTTSHTHAITTQLPSGTTAGVMKQSGTKAAGGFYGGTTDPSSTTRANYDGYLYATRFYGDGSQLTGITATGYSGTLPIANGGTGQTTASTAINALLPAQTGNSGKYLTTNGTAASWGALTSSQWTTTSSNIYYNTGNVGIGTVTPIHKLDVVGELGIGNQTTAYDNTTSQNFGGLVIQNYKQTGFGITTNIVATGILTGNWQSEMAFHTRNNQGTVTEKMRISDDGNVGIGTTSPTSKLHIVDASTNYYAINILKTGAVSTNSYGMDITVSGGSSWNEGIIARAQGTGSVGNVGVYAIADGAAPDNYGFRTQVSGGSSENYGIYTAVSGSTGQTYGGYFTNTSTSTSNKIGVYALTNGSSAGNNYGGIFSASGSTDNNFGCYGVSDGSTGTNNYGGYFLASKTGGTSNYGVYGKSVGVTTGTNIGGYFTASGSSTNNYGLLVADGLVGIGTLTPSYKLTVETSNLSYIANFKHTTNSTSSNGIIIQAGSNSSAGAEMIQFKRNDGTDIGNISQNSATTVAYNTTSDRRLKDNIVNTHFGINDLMKIQVRDYVYKADPAHTPTTGFIAQELYGIFPNAVTKPANEEEMWSVDYGKVTPLLVKAIQDQQATIEAQQKQIDELTKLVNQLMYKK